MRTLALCVVMAVLVIVATLASPGLPTAGGKSIAVSGKRIQSTSKSDTLRGTNRGDLINALGGADKIYAKGGMDTIRPGKGKDRVYGGKGGDNVYSKDGTRDVITCGPGKDWLTRDKKDTAKGCEVKKEKATGMGVSLRSRAGVRFLRAGSCIGNVPGIVVANVVGRCRDGIHRRRDIPYAPYRGYRRRDKLPDAVRG